MKILKTRRGKSVRRRHVRQKSINHGIKDLQWMGRRWVGEGDGGEGGGGRDKGQILYRSFPLLVFLSMSTRAQEWQRNEGSEWDKEQDFIFTF